MQWTTIVTLIIMISVGSLVLTWEDTKFHRSIKSPTVTDTTDENISFDLPYQEILDSDEVNPIFLVDRDREIKILPRAEYEISGYLVGKATNFGLRKLRKTFDRVVPVDYAIIWGNNATNEALLNDLGVDIESRVAWYYCKNNTKLCSDSIAYVSDDFNISNNHLLPANSNILNAIMSAKLYDKVQINGYLFDFYVNDKLKYETSLSRLDDGLGACENIYVTEIRINNKIYR